MFTDDNVCFPAPNQNLLPLITDPQSQLFVGGLDQCLTTGCIPDPVSLPRTRDGGQRLKGYPFNDPLLGTFILFNRIPEPTSRNCVVRSADILVVLCIAHEMVNISIDYTATTGDNG